MCDRQEVIAHIEAEPSADIVSAQDGVHTDTETASTGDITVGVGRIADHDRIDAVSKERRVGGDFSTEAVVCGLGDPTSARGEGFLCGEVWVSLQQVADFGVVEVDIAFFDGGNALAGIK